MCPLSFARRPLLSNKKQDYISIADETQKEVTFQQVLVSGAATGNKI
jgi:hypothetical protein